MNAPDDLQAILNALPSDLRQDLATLADAGRGLFGRTQTQSIIETNIAVFVRLRRDYAATHADLAAILHTSGITTRDGAPLTAATISSAISRALAKLGGAGGRRATRLRKSGAAASRKTKTLAALSSSASSRPAPQTPRKDKIERKATAAPVTRPRPQPASRDSPAAATPASRHRALLHILSSKEN